MIGSHPRSERGSALLISLLVIISLTGLGAVAFNSAVTATNTADYASMQRRAAQAAEVAVLSGVEYLNWNLDAVVAYAEGSGSYEFRNTDPVRSDLPVGDLFGTNPFGRGRLEPFFRVQYGDMSPARRAAEFDEGFCYMRLTMTGTAGIVDPDIGGSGAVSEFDLRGGMIARDFAGHFYVGPVRCPGYGG